VVASGELVLGEEVTDLRVGVGVGAAHETVTDETDANGFRHVARGLEYRDLVEGVENLRGPS
jgi:hypothetical protein